MTTSDVVVLYSTSGGVQMAACMAFFSYRRSDIDLMHVIPFHAPYSPAHPQPTQLDVIGARLVVS